MSCDPIGIKGGANLFSYASSNPIRFFYSDGKNPSEEKLAEDAFEKYLIAQGVDYQRKVAITIAVSGEWVEGEADFLVERGPDSWEPVEFKGRTSSSKTPGQKKYPPALEQGAAWSAARSTKKSALTGKLLSEVYGTGGGKVITLKSVADAKRQFRKIITGEYFNRTRGFKKKESSNLQGKVVEYKKSPLPAQLIKKATVVTVFAAASLLMEGKGWAATKELLSGTPVGYAMDAISAVTAPYFAAKDAVKNIQQQNAAAAASQMWADATKKPTAVNAQTSSSIEEWCGLRCGMRNGFNEPICLTTGDTDFPAGVISSR